MKIKELKALNESDLNKKLIELKKELMKLNVQVATGTTPKSPSELKKIKKTIAKIKTILKQKGDKKTNE